MSILTMGSARLRSVAHELTKFGTVGGLALVVNVIVSNIMWKTDPKSEITGSIIGSVVATAVSYVGNRYWTYKDRESIGRQREIALFAVVNGIGTLMESIPVALVAYVFAMNGALGANVGKYLLGVPLSMVFRLWTYRTWIFPKSDEDAVADFSYDAVEPLPERQADAVRQAA